jgi:hypothetical protein
MNGPGPPRDLLDRLTVPGDAEAAAREYLGHPDWLVGAPPAAVLAVMSDPRTSQDGDVVRLARAWPARDLVPALCALIESGPGTGRDRRAAWMVKQTVDAGLAGPVLRLAADRTRDRVVRRYLIEGVSRALWGEPGSWERVSDVTRQLLDDEDPLIREAGAQLINDTQGAPEHRATLLAGLLADDDDAVVLTALHALQALPRTPILADAVGALADHHHPEVRRLAGEWSVRPDPTGPGEGRSPE